MNSLGTASTSSPISYQLQFNFKFRKLQAPLLFVRSRTLSAGDRSRCCRVLCIAESGPKRESGSESERRGSVNSWDNENALSDWLGDSDRSGGSRQNQGIGGILGVGVASIFLVAGLTFVATSIGKRSSSRPKLEMMPLTKQQETFLSSGEEFDQEEHNDIDGIRMQDEAMSASSKLPRIRRVDGVDGTSRFLDSQSNLDLSKIEKNVDVRLITSRTIAELLSTDNEQGSIAGNRTSTVYITLEPSSSTDLPVAVDSQAANKADAESDASLKAHFVTRDDIGVAISGSNMENAEILKPPQSGGTPVGVRDDTNHETDAFGDTSVPELHSSGNACTSVGIPAPLLLSAALQVPLEKVLVPAVADQSQEQALAALQVLKVIESDAQPCELCTRRDYARWLVSASSALSRSSMSKVYPAMYIEYVTELAFDDVSAEDPDFASIQGLAEAGLISSKLSRRDMLSSEEDTGSFYFYPESPLSRQDLVTWKMALEKRQLPEVDRKTLHQLSGFIDVDKINTDAWPALVADLSAGEEGVIAQAFGYTRLFQSDKPVTKGQAAVALATGEAADVVSDELTRIEAESMAEKAVAAHNALVAEVEKDINASFERELMMEREKINAVQKMADEAKKEVERLIQEREEENMALMKERAAIDSEMEILGKLRLELEGQLESVMSNKVEVSHEKEKVDKLRKETEVENLAISRMQYELEVELRALSMARAWAEDEARRVQEHAKALEEARDRWERQGIKVVVDDKLREEASAEVVLMKKQLSVEESVERAENLTDKLRILAGKVEGKSKEVINKIIEKIWLQISVLKEWISNAERQTTELRDVAVAKVGGSVRELQERAKRVAGECREGIEKLTQRFKK